MCKVLLFKGKNLDMLFHFQIRRNIIKNQIKVTAVTQLTSRYSRPQDETFIDSCYTCKYNDSMWLIEKSRLI
jgi:hypothetical protein